MMRWALAEMRMLSKLMPRALSASISPKRMCGSITTPLPMTQVLASYRMPDGMRWNLNSSPSRTMVWPALLPPW